jgi:signal transduction histidine kinase
MAASYVLVSAAAVLLVEAVLIAVMVPRVRSADRAADQARQRTTQAEQALAQVQAQSLAQNLATDATKIATSAATHTPGGAAALIRQAAEGVFPGRVSRDGGGASVSSATVRVLADADGRAIAANPVKAFAAQAPLPEAARGGAPRDGRLDEQGLVSWWATAPIQIIAADGTLPRTIGIAYVEMDIKPKAGEDDAAASDTQQTTTQTTTASGSTIDSLVVPGMVVLVLLLPVGALFGLLTTRRLIRRIRRLSDGTAAMADGDLSVRIPVSGGDEIGSLERAFSSMAERLDAAVAEQRATAGAEARRAERGRIARELHDSISQEMFSIGVVAAGLRKALPAGSELREQAVSMERSVERTMREMRALLLELRPIQLEDAGLTAALDELCRTYEARLGIRITARLDQVNLDAPVEHAVLRLVQESVGNAIRHGAPSAIELQLIAAGERVELTVRDDGRGFDVREPSVRHGMGLHLMRERIRELSGVVEVTSEPDRGTTVRVSLPTRVAAPVG